MAGASSVVPDFLFYTGKRILSTQQPTPILSEMQ